MSAKIARTFTASRGSLCGHPTHGPLSYRWPVRPFGRQHPIRGNFGDPRTLTLGDSRLGTDSETSRGSFTFHNGIDISVPTGTPVYPVVSGTVDAMRYADEVSVDTGGRIFQYFHIAPRVHVGERVVAYRTELGRTLPRWLHVHMSEIDGFSIHNPLDQGHLEPYQDHTIPHVVKLLFRSREGKDLDPKTLSGDVQIVADALDVPPVAVPGEWFGLPVTPALVMWRMVSRTGKAVVAERTVADFRHTSPPSKDFWRVYAAGTYQNFPVFGTHYFFGAPGRYLFNLTPSLLNTSRLSNGDYDVTVRVADVCGNTSSLRQQVQIRNHQ